MNAEMCIHPPQQRGAEPALRPFDSFSLRRGCGLVVRAGFVLNALTRAALEIPQNRVDRPQVVNAISMRFMQVDDERSCVFCFSLPRHRQRDGKE